MWTKARADGRASAEGVWRGSAGRGRGRGPHRQCRPGPSRLPGRALRSLSSLSPCLSFAPLSFSSSPSPPLRFEGRGIHFNATRRPLLLGLRRAGGRDAPGSLRRLVWVRRAPWPPEDLNVFLPPRLPISELRRREGAAGWTPLLRDLSPPRHPELNGTSPGRSGLRFPFLWRRGGAPGLLPPEFGLRWVAGGRARCEPGSSYGLCARCLRLHEREAEGLRGRSRVPPGAAAWQPGTTPHFVLVFRFICAPFSFLSFSEKGKPNKRVSLFRACKVEDI